MNKILSKRLLVFISMIIITVICALFLTSVTNALDIPTSGYCGAADDGKNVQWSYDTENNVLTFSGTGAIADYISGERDWDVYYKKAKKIVVEEGITRVGSNVCENYSNVTELSLPSTLESIGQTFNGMSSLKELVLPSGLQEIEENSFGSIQFVRILDVPGIKTIKSSSFTGMWNGSILKLNEGTEMIESNALSGSFSTIYMPSTLTAWNDEFKNVQYIYGKNDTQELFAYKEDINYIDAGTNYDIENANIEINDGLFTVQDKNVYLSYNHNGEAVPLNEGIDYNVDFNIDPDTGGCTAIFNGIGCYSGSKTFELGEYYGYCGAGEDSKSVQWSYVDGILTIKGKGDMTGGGWRYLTPYPDPTNIKKVIIGEGIEGIMDYSFIGCSNLESVELPFSLKSIGSDAFRDCNSLGKIELPKSLTTLGDYVFNNTNIKQIELPKNLINLGNIIFNADSVELVVCKNEIQIEYCKANGYTYRDATEEDNTISVNACEITLEYERVEYDGTAKMPSVTVKYNDDTLIKDTDYTVEYSGNLTVGTGYVTVTGIGDYSEYKQLPFEIYEEEENKTSINDCDVVLEYERVAYDGTAKTPTVTVKYNNETLTEDTDYTVTYLANKAVGTATVTITGIGSYENAKDVTFTIYEEEVVNKTSIKECDVTIEYDRISYDGTEKTPTVTVVYNGITLTKGTDYTIEYSDNIEVGTATVTISGVGDYDNCKLVTFTIYEDEEVSKTSIRDCNITLSYNQVAYDGTVKKPFVTVKYNNKTLTQNIDYSVTYSNNTRVGTAQVTVNGINGYSDQKVLEFEIYDDSSEGGNNQDNTYINPSAKEVPSGYKAIRTVNDLLAISDNPSGSYILMNDIDLSGTKKGGSLDTGHGWTPINSFSGVLDGNGYRIKNLNMYGNEIKDQYIGFIGECSGKIENIGFVDAYIDLDIINHTYTYFGIICGAAYSANIKNCYVTGNINISRESFGNGTLIGGCCGDNTGSNIENCINVANIDVQGDESNGTLDAYGVTYSSQKSYNIGKINTSGFNGSVSIYGATNSGSNNYYLNSSLENVTDSAGSGTKLTSAMMKMQGSFTGFDFTDTWEIDPYCSYKYPQLKNNRIVRVSAVDLTAPTKLVYNQGDKLDLTNATIKVSYEDGINSTIKLTEEMLSGYDMEKIGEQTVTVTFGGMKKTFDIEVKEIPVTDVSLHGNVTMYSGEKKTLIANIAPVNASYKDVTWESGNTTVATVNVNGELTAKNAGKTMITATTHNGLKATCMVEVVVPCAQISLNKTEISLNVGQKEAVTAIVYPLESEDVVKWRTTNDSIAIVDGDGLITGMSEGSAIVTAYTDNGVEIDCYVYVNVTPQMDQKEEQQEQHDQEEQQNTDSIIVDTKENGSATNGNMNSNTIINNNTVIKPQKPNKVTKVKVKAKRGKLVISWKKVSNAEDYEIFVSTKKNFSGKKKYYTSKTSIAIPNIAGGKKHYIKIRGYNSYYDEDYQVAYVDGPWTTVTKKSKKDLINNGTFLMLSPAAGGGNVKKISFSGNKITIKGKVKIKINGKKRTVSKITIPIASNCIYQYTDDFVENVSASSMKKDMRKLNFVGITVYIKNGKVVKFRGAS